MADHQGLVRFKYLDTGRIVECGPAAYESTVRRTVRATELVDDESERVYAAFLEGESAAGATGDHGSDEDEVVDVVPVAVDATDAALRLAEESGVDLASIEGTGAGGRIVKRDVEAAINN